MSVILSNEKGYREMSFSQLPVAQRSVDSTMVPSFFSETVEACFLSVVDPFCVADSALDKAFCGTPYKTIEHRAFLITLSAPVKYNLHLTI